MASTRKPVTMTAAKRPIWTPNPVRSLGVINRSGGNHLRTRKRAAQKGKKASQIEKKGHEPAIEYTFEHRQAKEQVEHHQACTQGQNQHAPE